MFRLFLLAICFTSALHLSAQIIYDDAESTTLPWAEGAGNGTYHGRIDNPGQDPLGINSSTKVNSYTKSGAHPYSLLLADTGTPIDLSINNQFSIQINASAPTRFILKIEGGGQFMEQTRNIAVTNAWVGYTFDFSAAADFTGITRFILFFDPGVTESSDTYLFDNLIASPEGACTGVEPEPLILDDFECQRNGVYGVPGFDDILPVPNPDISAVNSSPTVGQYCDTCGGEWHVLVFDWNSADVFPVTTEGSSFVHLNLWTNKGGILKTKLEAGTSPAVEKDVPVTHLNSWNEYTIDFSDQIGANHRKLVFFFNAGVLPEPTDVYYIDDIYLSAPASDSLLEDFENGDDLNWSSLYDDEEIFGSFTGNMPNPDGSGVNPSPNVGGFQKGASRFGGLRADLPSGFSLSTLPQLNIQLLPPASATAFTLKLYSASRGLKAITLPVEETGVWTELHFVLSEYQEINDFNRIELHFDENLKAQDTWYFDNLTLTEATAVPCFGENPDPNIVDDYDCQRNVPVTVGLNRLTVLENPVPGGANPIATDLVGAFLDPVDQWSALVYSDGMPMDLSVYNQLSVTIWSPAIVPLLFKIEGGSGGPTEIFSEVSEANTWVTYTANFSGAAGSNHPRLALFFNAGVLPSGEIVYYIDDIRWSEKPSSVSVPEPLHIAIHPNPASETVIVNLPEEMSVLRILDITGRVVTSLPVEGKGTRISIPVTHLSQGIYFVLGNEASGVVRARGKFVKSAD